MTELQKRLFSDSLFSFPAKAVLLLALALALATGCARGPYLVDTAPAKAAGSGEISNAKIVSIDGIVSLDGRGYGGATIELYPFDAFNAGKAAPVATITAVSDEDGRFLLRTRTGRYLLLAHTPTHFSYFGRNPVNASSNQRSTSLPLVPLQQLEKIAVEAGEESLSGRVLHDNLPVKNAVVSLYLETDRGFRGPPYQSAAATGADGRYHIAVEPGRYFMVARLRKVGGTRGPMAPGDLFGTHPVMPLKVTSATAITTDIGVVELPSAERMSRFLSRFATLAGVVIDANGEPVAGLRPCLYENPHLLNDPVEVGQPTGSDGKFTIKTTRSGLFHLGARATLGGPPISGEPVGYAAHVPPEGLRLAPGSVLTDLRIIVRIAP